MKTDLFESTTSLHVGPVLAQSPPQVNVPSGIAEEISSTIVVPGGAVHLHLPVPIEAVRWHGGWRLSSTLVITTVSKLHELSQINE